MNAESELIVVVQVPKAYQEGFRKGYELLKQKDVPDAKKELFEALGIKETNRVSWGNYLNGITEPKASQAAAVEAVFLKYGILDTDIWGK